MKNLLIIVATIFGLIVFSFLCYEYSFSRDVVKRQIASENNINVSELKLVESRKTQFAIGMCLNNVDIKSNECQQYIPRRKVYDYNGVKIAAWNDSYKIKNNYPIYAGLDKLTKYFQEFFNNENVYLYFYSDKYLEPFLNNAPAYIIDNDLYRALMSLKFDNDLKNKLHFINLVVCIPLDEKMTEEETTKIIDRINWELNLEERQFIFANFKFVGDNEIQPVFNTDSDKVPYFNQEIDLDILQEKTNVDISYQQSSEEYIAYNNYYYHINNDVVITPIPKDEDNENADDKEDETNKKTEEGSK